MPIAMRLLIASLALAALAVPAALGCKVLQVVTNVGSWVPTTGPEHLRGESDASLLSSLPADDEVAIPIAHAWCPPRPQEDRHFTALD